MGKDNKKQKKITFNEKYVSLIVLGVLMLLFLQVGYQWVNSWLYFRRVQIVVAEESVVNSVHKAEGVLTRYEKIIFADYSGMVLGKIPEGDRVSVGGEVITMLPDYYEPEVAEQEEPHIVVYYYNMIKKWITDMFLIERDSQKDEADDEGIIYSGIGETTIIKSPEAGVVSYLIDGLEERYLPEYPYDLLEKYMNLDNKPAEGDSIDRNDIVFKGSPLFKIVDNYEWFFSIAVEHETGRIIGNRDLVEVTFSFAPEDPLSGYKVDFFVDMESELTYITYRFRRQIPGFSRHRWVEADLVYHTYKGIKVPQKAVLIHNGEQGVFINDRGIVMFSPISIIYEGDDFYLVEGIGSESIIITRPDLVEDGQRLE